jgi:hypothetical protein
VRKFYWFSLFFTLFSVFFFTGAGSGRGFYNQLGASFLLSFTIVTASSLVRYKKKVVQPT